MNGSKSDKKEPKMSREDRLVANLRANLRRRKAAGRKTSEKKPNEP